MNMLLNYDYPQICWPAWVNGFVSMAIIFVCTCRADKVTHQVLLRVKVAYVLLVMGSVTNLCTPWLRESPGWGSVVFASSVLAMLVADSFQWRGGVPPDSATGPTPLGAR